MKKNKREIDLLASLLDDEDEDSAVAALAELINRESELGDLPARLQENPNPLVRRRAHQLQAALILIRRRRAFRELLQDKNCDVVRGLLLIHLQWFDNDALPRIQGNIAEFCQGILRRPQGTLELMGDAFRASGMRGEGESTLKVENYCIGTVITDRVGAASVLALLAYALKPPRCQWRIARYHDEFGLSDPTGHILVPQRNWRLLEVPLLSELDFWEPRAVLLFAMNNLFAAAVNSDSFRYILTIAQALTGCDSDEPLGVLPYPYNPNLKK